jgi:hypothetical protein
MPTAEEEKEFKSAYDESLKELLINSKPQITVLTMLAEENRQHSQGIVDSITNRIKTVTFFIVCPVR